MGWKAKRHVAVQAEIPLHALFIPMFNLSFQCYTTNTQDIPPEKDGAHTIMSMVRLTTDVTRAGSRVALGNAVVHSACTNRLSPKTDKNVSQSRLITST